MNPTVFLKDQRAAQPDAFGDASDDATHPPPKLGFVQRLVVSSRGSRLLILICLFVSIMAFSYANKFEQLNAQLEFRKLTMGSVGSINLRIRNYAQVLSGTAAYVRVTPDMSIEAFEAYVASLELKQNSPGILGVGFIRAVPREDVMSTRRALEADYGRQVNIFPATKFDEKMIVTHMVPQSLHREMIGLDKGFEAGRRAALEQARRTGETILARRIAVEEELLGTAEFLMARAVFAPAQDSEAGAETFLGWVIAPFEAESALVGVTSNLRMSYNIAVFQGNQNDPEMLLFSTGSEGKAEGAFKIVYPIEQYGNSWLVHFASTPAFDRAYSSYFPFMLLILGVLFTMLVRSALRSMALRHRALKSLAALRMRQLGAREEENRALLETNVSVVMVLDSDKRIAFANQAAAVLFRMPREAFKGRPFDVFVQLDGGEETRDACNAQGVLATGERLLLDVQANNWRTADGLMQTTVLIRDVTEQINARRAVEALHQRYDTALTGAEIGIFEIDLVTGDAEMSETWHRIMGTDTLSVPFDHRVHFMARIHPADLPALVEADRRCIAGETARSRAEYRVTIGSEWRWMYSDAVPFTRTAEGRATKLIGTQSDITALRHARNALELSEARFRMVLEDAPVGMAVMDDTGTFIGVNAALSTLCGHCVNELRENMRLSHLLSRKDFVTLSRDVRELIKTDTAKTYQNQFLLKTCSGELRWGLFNLSWTFDKNRSAYVYIAQIVDITDQKRVEQIKSEFVATVSHELRTPLTSIKGALGLLDVTTDNSMPQNAKRLLDIALINADRLTATVNDILDLERISSGEIVFELENIEVQDIIVQTVSEAAQLAQEHGNTLQIEQNSMALAVQVDRGRIRQVLLNLLSNACKFSDPDTVVTVRWGLRAETAILYVENTGPPVPESFREQIFGAFTQLDASDTRNIGGTGLGLSIARQIVTRLGGQIGFEHHAGRRTVFWFTCPLAAVQESDDTQERKIAG